MATIEDNNGVEMVLGDVHLASMSESSINLYPQPTSDPDDPLNWSTWRKTLNYTLTFVITIVIFTQLAMQTVFWQQMIPDLEVDYKQLNNALAVNYTGTACGCLLFIPFSIKYGRRPVYLISIAVMTALAFWTSRITSVTELYITNLLCGLSGSTNETLVQMTIVDLFFVHQRGRMNALYTIAAASGSFLIPIAAGKQAETSGWRWCYITLGIANAVVFVIFALCFEESKFVPVMDGEMGSSTSGDAAEEDVSESKAFDADMNVKQRVRPSALEASIAEPPQMISYARRLRLTTPTEENLVDLFFRPLEALIFLPAVLFTAFEYGVSLCWVAVITSVQAYYMPYPPWNFGTTAMGLLNLGPSIGLLIGAIFGGYGSDKMIVFFAKRNKGVFEPEMRLYLQFLTVIFQTAGLLMFGICMSRGMPWIYSSAGYVLYGFGWGVGVTSVTYMMDTYTRIAGEAFVGVAFIRNIISVGILFALTPWIDAQGLLHMFITMGVLCFIFAMLYVPMVYTGKGLRKATSMRYTKMAARKASRD